MSSMLMETVLDNRQLATAIANVEFNLTLRENMLKKPVRDRAFLSSYTEALRTTSALLRAVQDPSSCTTEQLLEIILTKPEVVDSVGRFTMGQFRNQATFMEELIDVTFRQVHPELADKI